MRGRHLPPETGTVKQVGAGLLANAVDQSADWSETDRFREQARAHIQTSAVRCFRAKACSSG